MVSFFTQTRHPGRGVCFGTHREETILFAVLADLLVGNWSRFRCVGTVVVALSSCAGMMGRYFSLRQRAADRNSEGAEHDFLRENPYLATNLTTISLKESMSLPHPNSTQMILPLPVDEDLFVRRRVSSHS